MLVGMDIEGMESLAGDVRTGSEEIRLRYRDVLGVLDHGGHTTPASIHGLARIADRLVSDAADLHRRAALFREAEQLTLGRLSLSLTLRAWTGTPIDATRPGPPPATVVELTTQIDRLTHNGAPSQQVTELRVMLALVTAAEAASQRRAIQEQLGRLSPGIPTPEWYHAQAVQFETEIMELLVTELRQERLLFGLESGFSCIPGEALDDRYEEIEIQLAYLEWELAARQSDIGFQQVGDLITSIDEQGLYEQMTFVGRVAGDLDAHPDGLPVALLLLAGMDQPHQAAVMARVAENDHLESLLAAVEEFEASLQPSRSRFGPAGDFVGGAWDSVWGSVTGIWGLTLQGVYDGDGWKENWGGVGDSFRLLFESPCDFFYQMADIETLRDNPARWVGGLAPDVAATALTGGTVTAAARSGRLGTTLSRIAAKLDNLTLRLGAQLDTLITNPSLRRMIDRLADDTGAISLGGTPWRLADIDPADLLEELRRRGDLPDDIFEQLDGHLLDRHVGWTDAEVLERMDMSGLPRASTFTDETTARAVTFEALTSNSDMIKAWVAAGMPDGKLYLDVPDSGRVLGRVVESTDRVVRDAYRATILIKKAPDGAWYVLTGYLE